MMHKCSVCRQDFECSKESCAWPYEAKVPCGDCTEMMCAIIRELYPYWMAQQAQCAQKGQEV